MSRAARIGKGARRPTPISRRTMTMMAPFLTRSGSGPAWSLPSLLGFLQERLLQYTRCHTSSQDNPLGGTLGWPQKKRRDSASWSQKKKKEGSAHGRYLTYGAVTSRMVKFLKRGTSRARRACFCCAVMTRKPPCYRRWGGTSRHAPVLFLGRRQDAQLSVSLRPKFLARKRPRPQLA